MCLPLMVLSLVLLMFGLSLVLRSPWYRKDLLHWSRWFHKANSTLHRKPNQVSPHNSYDYYFNHRVVWRITRSSLRSLEQKLKLTDGHQIQPHHPLIGLKWSYERGNQAVYYFHISSISPVRFFWVNGALRHSEGRKDGDVAVNTGVAYNTN